MPDISSADRAPYVTLRRAGASFALCCATAFASAQSPVGLATETNSGVVTAERSWSLRLPLQDPVPFKGVTNLDGAGFASTPMMYPGYGPGMFLGAILAHGLTTAAARQAQKNEMQRAADQVLVPYQEVLSTFTHDRLRSGLRSAPASESAANTTWEIESAPTFALTADQTALVLENVLAVRRTGSASDTPAFYANAIKVVSQRIDQAEPLPYWTADGGKQLQSTSARLLQESIDIALDAAVATPQGQPSPEPATQRTYRYWEGTVQKMERAELISDRCSRIVLRTLRGTILSVPAGVDGRDCKPGPDAAAMSASN